MTESVKKQLVYFFNRNGYFRIPDPERQRTERETYKKGYEIRFTAEDKEELLKIRKLLSKAGFKCGKPYSDYPHFIQPVYGKKSFEKFQCLLK